METREIIEQQIAKIKKENPDLTCDHIKQILLAQQEIKEGKLELYKSGKEQEL